MKDFVATALYDHGKAYEFSVTAVDIRDATRQALAAAPMAVSVTVQSAEI